MSPEDNAARNLKTIMLRSCDGVEFEIDEKIILNSETIRDLLKERRAEQRVITLEETSSSALAKVVEYWNQHLMKQQAKMQLLLWDQQFVKMDAELMFDVLVAASFLQIEPLHKLMSQAVSDAIKAMTAEEKIKFFGFEDDFKQKEPPNASIPSMMQCISRCISMILEKLKRILKSLMNF